MKKQLVIVALWGIGAWLAAGTVQASVITDALSFDGVEDQINAESRTATNGGISVDVGFKMMGFIRIGSIEASSSGTTDFNVDKTGVLIYSAQIISGGGTIASPWILAPIADITDPFDLRNIAPALTTAAIGNGATAADLDKAVFIGGSRVGSNDYLGDVGASAVAELAAIDASLDYDLTVGISSPSDFMDAVDGRNSTLDQQGGFSVLNHDWGSVIFLPVAMPGPPLNPLSTHQVALRMATLIPTVEQNWDYQDPSIFAINAVPEPASVVSWAGLLMLIGLIGYRRRR